MFVHFGTHLRCSWQLFRRTLFRALKMQLRKLLIECLQLSKSRGQAQFGHIGRMLRLLQILHQAVNMCRLPILRFLLDTSITLGHNIETLGSLNLIRLRRQQKAAHLTKNE